MPLTAGTRLGAYEILAPLGAGGMGEVYKARDTSLGRDVALKIIPGVFAADPDRLRRFVLEAQAAAALDHPNIVAIHQIGQHDGAPFIVSELLKGATLRERMRDGLVPLRKALDYTIQAARGLAAAHDRGIVHRDLKPENVFVTDDGRVKILDFGLAKLTPPNAATGDSTMEIQTGAGTVLGTVGYMSPEQVRGQVVDARSDLFSLGAMLYEMLAGRRAFQRHTTADTMTAVLQEDPPEIGTAERPMPPLLERVVKRCLEKAPQERFQSARDLAFALEDVTSVSTPHGTIPGERRPASRRPLTSAALVAVVLALAAAGALWSRLGRATTTSHPTFQRLTFRRGALLTGRFAPDAKTIVYGAAWDGSLPEVYAVTADGPESRSIGQPKTDLYAVSSTGELALSLRTGDPFPPRAGVLARMPVLGGAAPREVHSGVEFADWAPDGSLAVTLDTGVGDRLEYPIGTMLYEREASIHQVRVSPDGALVAFEEAETATDSIAVVDKARKKTTITTGWIEIAGLAWTADGSEIWFGGHRKDLGWGLFAVTRDGRERLLLGSPGPVSLKDLAKDGRVLMSRESRESGIRYMPPGGGEERDLSWLDSSRVGSLSSNSRQLLFSETGAAAGFGGAVYLRKTDGSPAARLGDGSAVALSPDGRLAMTVLHGNSVVLLPTGAGTPKTLKGNFVRVYSAGGWLPDGSGVVFGGIEPKHDPRVYVQKIDGDPRAISGEGLLAGAALSPDGRRFATVLDRKPIIIDVERGTAEPQPAIPEGYQPVAWAADGRSLFIEKGDIAAALARYDLASGAVTPWKTLLPSDRAGVMSVDTISITPDERSYAYTYTRRLSELYLVTGIK
jgi:Tol biopolymer transport system component